VEYLKLLWADRGWHRRLAGERGRPVRPVGFFRRFRGTGCSAR